MVANSGGVSAPNLSNISSETWSKLNYSRNIMSSFSWCCGEAGREFRMQTKEGRHLKFSNCRWFNINVRMPYKHHNWSSVSFSRFAAGGKVVTLQGFLNKEQLSDKAIKQILEGTGQFF